MEGRIVLDASALLAALFGELGADFVEARIERAIVSAVNLSEVGAKLCDRGLDKGDLEVLLASLDLPVRVFDEAQAMLAAALRCQTKRAGLSLGDRACLALAISEGIPAVTTDRTWARLAPAIGVEVVLAR
ncbi:MAG: type II toxin-antitoxin system VapC family toxin [Bryobacterales bacterium]|nr:type II toxin-antitoxin system VapC family toxin [Bryobacterales bacterium]